MDYQNRNIKALTKKDIWRPAKRDPICKIYYLNFNESNI